MNQHDLSQQNSRRLDPFMFPAATTLRFVILLIAVVSAGTFIYDLIFYSFHTEAVTAALRTCADRTVVGTAAFSQCMVPIRRVEALWWLSGVGVLLAVAAIIYWIFPAWRIRRHRLTPLRVEDAPELIGYLTELSQETGVHPAPQILINPHSAIVTGLAFGRLGRYYVALSAGLVTKFYTDRPTFRAIVLHELAHLRNKDVDKAYFAVAVGWAFLIAAVAPFFASALFSALLLSDVLNFGWRVLLLTALVFAIRNAVLRARELYADVRASTWTEDTAALRRVLALLPEPDPGIRRRIFGYHPRSQERLQTLHDTRHLFRMEFGTALATGVTATIALSSGWNVLSVLTVSGDYYPLALTSAELAALGAGLLFMSAAVAVVGSIVWRSAFAARLLGKAIPVPIGPAVGLSLGFFLGSILSIQEGQLSYLYTPVRFLIYALLAFLMLITLLFVLECVASSVLTWSEVSATRRRARRAYVLGLMTAAVATAVLVAPLIFIREASMSLLTVGGFTTLAEALLSLAALLGGYFWVTFQSPVTMVPVVAVWAFPLLAGLWRSYPSTALRRGWAFLDEPAQSVAVEQINFGLKIPVLVSLVTGAVVLGWLLVLRVARHYALLGEGAYVFLVVTASVLGSPVVAVIVSVWVRQLRVVVGLLGAFLTGCLITAANLTLVQLGACVELLSITAGGSCSWTSDLVLLSNFFGFAVGNGMMLAVPSVVAVLLTATLWQMVRPA